MATEREKFPHCPYCGTEMRCDSERYITGGGYAAYRCPKCRSMSPIKEDMESFGNACKNAYYDAMHRCKPHNQVLTIDDLLKTVCCWGFGGDPEQEIIMWLEYKDVIKGYTVVKGMEAHGEKTLFKFSLLGADGVFKLDADACGSRWRCWSFKPTQNALKETPWEGEKNA